VT
ncbi:hypothetical protein J1605_017179, partial [Eschrichtius robustus]|jgi:hypothetical protein